MTSSPITLEDFIVQYCAYHSIGTQRVGWRKVQGQRAFFFFFHLDGSYVSRKVN